MTTFYICRHGQTENNLYKRLSGWLDSPLTEEGVQNALSAAQKVEGIHFDAIIASDLGRAFITAYLIARQLGNTSEILRAKDLREVNYGELANKPYASYPALSPKENTNYTPLHGESLAHMQQRVLRYIQKLSASHPDKTFLVVAHDGTINAVRAAFLGQEIGAADATHQAHDYVGTFRTDGNAIVSFREVT